MGTRIPIRRKLFLWLKRILKWSLIALVTYATILLVGLIPVNNDFVASNESGVRIYVVSNAVHADIIVPASNTVVDWPGRFSNTEFRDDIQNESHVAFGWGDRGFFLETKTWDDFKLSTAANALLVPSGSCVHVAFTNPEYYRDSVSVTISPEQYRQLVHYIDRTFQTNDDGEYIQILGEAYSSNDAFFQSNGRYHLFNTCNSWVGRGLKTAGVKTPWFSPMPKSPMLYLDGEKRAR